MVQRRSTSPADHFQGLQTTERFIGRVEPPGNGLFVDHLAEPLPETVEFLHSAKPRFAHGFSTLPVSDRSLGKPRKPGEQLPADAKSKREMTFTEAGESRLEDPRRNRHVLGSDFFFYSLPFDPLLRAL